uniref:Uncharacterized protein n=1 Tax=Anser brachyrhynchus TaxID=132585 RepID=A0A8B9BHY7_9AVES
MGELRVRSVLVTGANRGIGLGFVRHLLGLPNPPEWVFAACRDPKGQRAQELQNLASKHPNLVIIPLGRCPGHAPWLRVPCLGSLLCVLPRPWGGGSISQHHAWWQPLRGSGAHLPALALQKSPSPPASRQLQPASGSTLRAQVSTSSSTMLACWFTRHLTPRHRRTCPRCTPPTPLGPCC